MLAKSWLEINKSKNFERGIFWDRAKQLKVGSQLKLTFCIPFKCTYNKKTSCLKEMILDSLIKVKKDGLIKLKFIERISLIIFITGWSYKNVTALNVLPFTASYLTNPSSMFIAAP